MQASLWLMRPGVHGFVMLGAHLLMMNSGMPRCTWCSSHSPSLPPPTCAVWRANSTLKKGPTRALCFLLPRPCCIEGYSSETNIFDCWFVYSSRCPWILWQRLAQSAPKLQELLCMSSAHDQPDNMGTSGIRVTSIPAWDWWHGS